jgi:hypothetical protein
MDSSRFPSWRDIVTTRLLRLIGADGANDMCLAIVLISAISSTARQECERRELRSFGSKLIFFGGRVPDIFLRPALKIYNRVGHQQTG